MFSIVVKFNVNPEYKDTLVKVLVEDGKGSLKDEPGTVRFDVIQDASNPNILFLYESYQDQIAFEAHTQGEYYKKAIEVFNEMTSNNYGTVEELGRGATLFP
ncbi:MAG: antibiotic biosynthesis monooxygenase [Microcystis aeruginosa G13-12]|jgi:autoinducer 2-degrading protein|uniref:Antibiotic biosynthesis monooxygenase n=1 Tax=Microcystis aeruginosa Ma_OC_H_19870700_S124 TaxID=2486262 RepID=A0A552AS73_MICAE|nr:putative quinol monooxygenase [Burkholderiales bacterium]NCR12296.1 antibiotic biosynthesis monooxygenase [Microcystis aeruginosa SX13-11]NCR43004.1 antibiotic biosynthesis monooxygenase [Microcystis aeruginosa SX13-01]NCR87836.1 antibiotic biosynthesis monooxygenase [Microcystis aeruginosa G13-10]NCS15122.1 antibiotic biosynthesis monooxygenase [Microcystis aeruginosa G13-12]NCS32958.1 antibiotic biosynthesis monooxygenase [Microcystis aeruginosa G11-01]NCT50228.1 antibiotic biosynthesis 